MSIPKRITGEFISQLGTVKVEIIDNVEPDITFDIATIGSINYDFDQTPDSLSVDRVQALYSFVDISAPNFSRTGVNIWERLINATQDTSLRVLLTVGSFEFLFRLRASDMSFDERSRLIKMRLIPFINDTATAREVFAKLALEDIGGSVSIGSRQSNQISQSFKLYAVKDFIQRALNIVFGNNNENTYLSAKINIEGLPNEIYGLSTKTDDTSFCMLDTWDEANQRDKFSPLREGATEFEGTGFISDSQNGLPIDDESTSLRIVFGTQTSFLTEIQKGDIIFIPGGELGVVVDVFSNELMSVDAITSQSFNQNSFSVLRPIVPHKIPALQILKDLAGMEGAFFGTGFSRNFYVNRIRKEDITPVTLDWNKVVNFSPSMYSLSLGRSFVAQRASFDREGAGQYGRWPLFSETFGDVDYNIPNLSEFESITTGNPNGTKGLEIGLAPAYPMLNKVLMTLRRLVGPQGTVQEILGFVSRARTINNVTEPQNTAPEAALTSIGLQSYFQALNNSSNGLMVEFTILDAFSIKPWDIFQFDSRAPEKYRNRQWRVTKIAYNIIDNTVTVKAYQIDDIQTPVFARNPLNFGINASFGQGLLPSGLYSSVQAQIGDAVGDTQDVLFTTAQQVSGETTQFFLQGTGQLDPSAFPNGVVALAGYSVKIVIPTTLESFNAVLTQDLRVVDQVMSIESINIGNRVIPTGSYVFVSQKQVSAGIITGDLSARLFAEADTIGVLTDNVVGSVTAIPVLLNTRVRKGQDLDILGTVFIGGAQEPRVYHFTVSDDYEAGFHNAMGIESGAGDAVYINARAGDSIRGNPVATQAEIVISPGEINLSVQNERNEQSIAIIDEDITEIIDIELLPVGNIENVKIFNGQRLAIIGLGTEEPIEVIVDGDQNLPNTGFLEGYIGIQTQTLPRVVRAGETIVEPSYAQTGKIGVLAGRIVLFVDNNGDVATIELGSGDVGSTINIKADQVSITNVVFENFNNTINTGLIRSSDFDEGVTGWRIDGNGNAEFNNVTTRGTIVATNGKIADFDIFFDALTFTRDNSNVSFDAGKSGRSLTNLAGSFDTAGFYLNDDNYLLFATQGDFSPQDAIPVFRAGGSSSYFRTDGSGNAIVVLPTSDSGLPTGALWNDAGTIKVKT